MAFIFLAVIAGVVASRRPASDTRLVRESLLVGLGMFVIPAFLIDLAVLRTYPPTRAGLLTLVPLFAVVFEPYIIPNIDGTDRRQSRFALLAALVGVAGSICIFPVELPSSIQAFAAFCAVILAAASIAFSGCKAVAVTLENPAFLITMAAIASGVAALFNAGASAVLEQPTLAWQTLWPELLWSAAVELPALALLFWLMRRLTATRMATRYLLAPMIAIVAGAVLAQAPINTWICFGVVLMAASAAWLLFAPEARPESTGLTLH
jgi:drug/metabolite transporter (DMT)-like permease